MKITQKGTTTVLDTRGDRELPAQELPVEPTQSGSTAPQNVSVDALASALTKAIEASRPARITVANRKKNTPWTPKDGSPKLRLKRKLFQHGIAVSEDRLTNEQIKLANQIRPGMYCENYVKVIRRRDKGIDIDYPIRSAPQRLRLVTDFGITSFTQLLQRIIDEAAQPKKPDFDEFGDAN